MVGGFGVGRFGEECDRCFIFVAVFEEIVGNVFGGGGVMENELAQSHGCEAGGGIFLERLLGIAGEIVGSEQIGIKNVFVIISGE